MTLLDDYVKAVRESRGLLYMRGEIKMDRLKCYCEKCLYNIRASNMCGYNDEGTEFLAIHIGQDGVCSQLRDK